MLDLKIINGNCYIDGHLKETDLSVQDGIIRDIGQITDEAKDTIDAKGLIVLPGCIDKRISESLGPQIQRILIQEVKPL